MNAESAPRRFGTGSQAGHVRGLVGATFSTADLVAVRPRAAGLSLDVCRSSRGARAGARLSRLRGRGMEYSESRIYLPGDDIRSIDWRVTARTGRTHTKLFHQERDRPVLFVVDLGSHMRFGTRRAFKSVVVAEAVSLLAWAAAQGGDRVGGIVLGDKRAAESRVRGGQRGALALIRALAEVESVTEAPSPGGDFADALARAHRVVRPGSLVIAISDFSGLRDAMDRHLARLREHNDLLCVWVYDMLEAAPPPPARYPIGDGLRTATLDTRSGEVVRAVAQRFERIETRINSACERTGAMLVRVRCGDDVRGVLRDALTGRLHPSRRRTP